MCGIAGGVAVRGDARVNHERLRRMAALLAHRGPDAEGFWSDPAGRAGLAHRRLSVIDQIGGATPASITSGSAAWPRCSLTEGRMQKGSGAIRRAGPVSLIGVCR